MLQCEYPKCPAVGGDVKDYDRFRSECVEDEEGPLSEDEKDEWMKEPIALCRKHAQETGHISCVSFP